MTDYLHPVGRAWRTSSIVASTLASIVCLVLSFVLGTDMMRRQSLTYDDKPLWLALVLVGAVGVASAFIAWRLVGRRASANGVTDIPVWFIQLFGVLLLLGFCFVAYHRGTSVFMVEGAMVCLAMIFLSRRIATRRRLRP